MKGSELVAGLPPTAGPAREEAIFRLFEEGLGAPVRWATLTTSARGCREARIVVAEDVLMVGAEDPVRVAVCALTAQRLADLYGALLPTSRVSDLAWQQAAVRLDPLTQVADAHMADTSRFVAHSEALARAIAGRLGLAATVGKDWIASPRALRWPGWAVNYGWHARSGTPIQGLGRPDAKPFHDVHHVDYSQWAPRLVQPVVEVDGEPHPFAQLAADPALCALVSSEGPIASMRCYPGPK